LTDSFEQDFTAPVFGRDVIFDVPGEVFAEQRRFLQLGLSITNLRAYVGMIEDEVQRFLQTSPAFAALQNDESTGWSTFDANSVMSEVIIFTATRTLHGSEVRERIDKTIAGYYNDLDGGLGPISYIIPKFPLIPTNWKRDRAQRALSKFYINIIRKRKAAGSDNSENDLMATLLEQRYRDGTPLKEHVIAHLMIALLMAGRHSSSATTAWILMYLGNNPEIAEALYAEQVQYFRDSNGKLRGMTLNEVRQLPLMNAVIRETLRMHPPVHSMSRFVRQDTSVPVTIAAPSTGLAKDAPVVTYVVPKGHHIIASPAVSQNDANIWRDVRSWDPYRWTDPKGVAAGAGRAYANEMDEGTEFKSEVSGLGSESPYQPFGAGEHRCIGEQVRFSFRVFDCTFIYDLTSSSQTCSWQSSLGPSFVIFVCVSIAFRSIILTLVLIVIQVITAVLTIFAHADDY
jgi:sterol 14alpha-demethylase